MICFPFWIVRNQPKNNELTKGIIDQTEHIFTNIQRMLAAVDLQFSHILKVTVF
ncbi:MULTISPECIES: Rid family hydrolase [Enterococcus]|uniref:Rid family hydrolase n=1 Tax=Enterococcus TaxID=1350 RepID=UPI0002ED3FA6